MGHSLESVVQSGDRRLPSPAGRGEQRQGREVQEAWNGELAPVGNPLGLGSGAP